MERVFVAILPGKQVLSKIENFQYAYKTLNRWIPSANIHLTLQFLGWIDTSALSSISSHLQQIAHRTLSFQVSYESLGLFPNAKRPRILWIGVKEGEKEIFTITQQLKAAHRRFVVPEEKAYVSHLTVARLKNTSKSALSDIMRTYKDTYFGKDVVRDIMLMRSVLHRSGSVYSILKRFKLRERYND